MLNLWKYNNILRRWLCKSCQGEEIKTKKASYEFTASASMIQQHDVSYEPLINKIRPEMLLRITKAFLTKKYSWENLDSPDCYVWHELFSDTLLQFKITKNE